MKEYLLVSNFKVIRSSDNMEVTKRKTQSKIDKALLRFIRFFTNFSTQCNATLRQPEIVSFAIERMHVTSSNYKIQK